MPARTCATEGERTGAAKPTADARDYSLAAMQPIGARLADLTRR